MIILHDTALGVNPTDRVAGDVDAVDTGSALYAVGHDYDRFSLPSCGGLWF